MPFQGFLNRIIKRLDSIHAKLLAAVDPLDSDRFNQRPAENEWSVAEILHHLCLVEERVVADLERGLAGEPHTVGLLRRLIPTSIVASRLVRVKAPRSVTPANPPEKNLGLKNYDAARNRLKELCSTEGKEKLKRVVFNHPFLGKLDGAAAVSFVGYHELRHYKQIREVLKKQLVT
jgi:hypothetical protein